MPITALALSTRTIDRHGHGINSAEDRTLHEPSSVICMRLAARITYSDSGMLRFYSLHSAVATSTELIANVDRDGQSINSAGGRTPHEPLSVLLLLLRLAGSSHTATLTMASAH